MKIIAISGYKSFIGNHFYNNKNKNKNKIIHYKKNINNISELKKFIIKNKVTHFVNFAGLSRINCSNNKTECIKTNFNSIKSIINFFNKLNYKPMFIFMSTCHIYGNKDYKINENSKIAPNSLYAKIKLKSEEYIKKNYKNYSILRLFNVYGPNQPKSFFIPDMIKKIKNNQSIKIDKSIRDFIHVKTISRVINFIISKEITGVLNVGSGRGQSLETIINLISNKLKKKPLLEISNKKTKIVANIKFLTSKGFKFRKNEKNFNI